MKIAVINHRSSVGGWKYLYNLLLAMVKIDSTLQITVLTRDLQDEIGRPYIEILNKNGIEVIKFRPNDKIRNKKYFGIKFIDKKINAARLNSIRKKNQSILKDFDLIFYSWPYFMEYIDVNVPMFFIPHDFIFTHFFGSHASECYSRYWNERLTNELADFVKNGKAIVSSNYIAKEFKRTFPEAKNPNVVYLTVFNNYEKVKEDYAKEVLKKYGIEGEYILFANNDMLHKNMPAMVGAFYYIKQKHPNLKLIITGDKTPIYCKANSPYYWDHVRYDEDYDIKSLGILPDDEFSVILQNAKLLVNPSLCEAGCGNGIDAWFAEVPTAISEIEPFKNHVEFLNVKTEFFDPRNSSDIANKIIYLLDNPEVARENAKISKEAMNKYTWNDVAKQYLDIFKKG